MPEYNGTASPEEQQAFKDRVDRKAAQGRVFDPVLECASCKYAVRESIVKARGFQACPNCGGLNVVVKTLNYNDGIKENPLPTVAEATRDSQARPAPYKRNG